MLTKTKEKMHPELRDRSLRQSDISFRILAETTPAENSVYWGEHLLLRMADRELRRLKAVGGFSHNRAA